MEPGKVFSTDPARQQDVHPVSLDKHETELPPLSPDELRDLQHEAGRELTEAQAQAFRIRKLKQQCVENMLSKPAGELSQQDRRDLEMEVGLICARAQVCCIGIQSGSGLPDIVLFQPMVTTLSVPLAAFADPDKAIELIKRKLAELGKISKNFVEVLVIAALAFSIGLNLGLMLCRK